MPLYEYECDACAHRFEVIQKYSDPPIETCPKCGGSVHKLQSAPAFQFKGSGWYITDYAKKDSSTAKQSDAAAEKTAKGEKQEPSQKSEKSDKAGTSEKTDKAEKKTDAPPKSSSAPAANAGSTKPSKS